MSERDRRDSRPAHDPATGLEIAIIGMAGRFPGAKNIGEFWDNLKNGVESISFFARGELTEAGIDRERLDCPDYVRAKGVLEDIEYFDASFFDYSVREAESMDPQARLFHECVWEALADAGYDPGAYDGSIGVYAGASGHFNWEVLGSSYAGGGEAGSFAAAQFIDKDFLATAISYRFDLKGPSFTLQTACSTSLVAVHLGCQGLLSGECDMAVVGGVSVSIPGKSGYIYQEGLIVSADGHCRPFDARANGTVFGSGVGAAVLKSLGEAVTDGDSMYAVIKGSAVNNDGKRKVGFSAPSPKGQAEVIRLAYNVAAVEVESIGYIEAHGTGTAMGDPIEVEAFNLAFDSRGRGYCGIGSVKGNVGHLDAAAGAAGLIKTALVLKHGLMVPSLHFERANPKIDFENSPFYVNTVLSQWQGSGHPRRAGVSSFGVGGTNAHVVLQQAPPVERSSSPRPWQILLFSARSETALRRMTANLADFLSRNRDLNLADAAYTLQVGRKAFEYRRLTVCKDIDEAVEALTGEESAAVHTHYLKPGRRSMVFMFPGQGSQYVNMGLELYRREKVFRQEMDRCLAILNDLVDFDIKGILYPGIAEPKDGAMPPDIDQTEVAQPLIFMFEYAMAQLLIKWGIKPEAMIGHSLGEYTAACLSGVFSLQDALKLVVLRGRLMQPLATGAMVSVGLCEGDVKRLLNGELSLAAVNAPELCVVSGTQPAIDRFTAVVEANARGRGAVVRPLHTSHAFHSPMMDAIIDEFEQCVAGVTLNPPRIPFISNVTGRWIAEDETADPRYWGTHLRRTVRFSDGIDELLKDRENIFVEVGPGRVLSTFVRKQVPPESSQMVVNLTRHPHEPMGDAAYLLEKIGELWLYGGTIDWQEFYRYERRHRISLPAYPFEGRRYWRYGDEYLKNRQSAAVSSRESVKRDIDRWCYVPCWKRSPEETGTGAVLAADTVWLIFLDDEGLGEGLANRLEQAGLEVLRVGTGSEYTAAEGGHFTLNPRQYDDYVLLLREIRHSGRASVRVVHLWSVTDNNKATADGGLETGFIREVQDRGVYSLLHLVKAMKAAEFSGESRIDVVSNHLFRVTGSEAFCAPKGTLLAAVKVVPQEYPNIDCRSIDIVLPDRDSPDEKDLIEFLLQELSGRGGERIVAYRHHGRWIRNFEPLRFWDRPKREGLKKGGTYLIIGGTGEIGLWLADYLARSFQARLVLVGRSSFPAREEWAEEAAVADGKERLSRKISRLLELEAVGAEVLALSGDISDEEQMAEVFARAEARFGSLNGIFHAAGVLDDRTFVPIEQLGRAECESQFQAKLYGLPVLERVLKGRQRPLDFCLLISSLSSVLGGLGYLAYSAANIFMDHFVQARQPDGDVRWIAVNMDSWQIEAAGEGESAALSMRPQEGVRILEKILSQVGVNQVVVATGDLESRLKQWVGLSGAEQLGTSHRRPALTTPFATPQSQTERVIARLWQDFFGLDQVGIHDNFFDLGATSLDLVQLNRKLRKTFDRDIPLTAMFRYATIEALARFLNQDGSTGVDRVVDRDFRKTRSENRSFDTAVIGLAGRFPGAKDIDEFWENLQRGEESIFFFADEELAAEGIPAEQYGQLGYVKAKGLLEDIEYFDASFFDYSPREAEIMDPQMRILHECCWHVLEQAGYNGETYKGLIGLYLGAQDNPLWQGSLILSGLYGGAPEGFAASQLADKDHVSTRISYKFNLRGPSFTLATQCSTSLAAVHLAWQALGAGECDMALAGGISATLPGKCGYIYREGLIVSPDGHCRPFDARANGTVFGSGAGIVLLKRLAEALADRDTVWAVIKGSAINNDGRDKAGYTAPGTAGQARVIRAALRTAGLEPESIGYVETHGTGTALGDPIEIEALTLAFNSEKRGFCGLGSVKGNVGHLDHAAGIAGLIKTVLSLRFRLIPASLHFQGSNPDIDFENSPFYVNTVLSHWRPHGGPRRAGVSSFGVGGTNVHLVLQEAPKVEESSPAGECQLLLLSAHTDTALRRLSGDLADFLKANKDINLADAAYTLQVGRKAFEYRRVLLCGGIDGAIDALNSEGGGNIGTHHLKPETRPVVFVFPGQGSPVQHVNLGQELYRRERVFREEMDRCLALLSEPMDFDFKEILTPGASPRMSEAQLSVYIFVFEYALARLLMSWGVKAEAMVGRGAGEYTAACLSGLISLPEAFRLVLGRDEWSGPGLAEALDRSEGAVLLEIGSGDAAAEWLKRHGERQTDQVIIELVKDPGGKGSEVRHLLAQIGRLWLYGIDIDWDTFYRNRQEKRRRLPLPLYPFEGQRFCRYMNGLSAANGESGIKLSRQLAKRELSDWFYIPSWKRSLVAPCKGDLPLNQPGWLVFLDECGLGAKLVDRLEDAGARVVRVTIGEEFAKLKARSFTMDPANRQHYVDLFAELEESGQALDVIVHLWSVTAAAFARDFPELGLYSLLNLMQVIGEPPVERENSLAVFVLTNHMHEVTGDEEIVPLKATLSGAIQVIPREYPFVKCRSLDIVLPEPASRKEEKLIGQLLEEFKSGIKDGDSLVAYRGSHRLVRVFEPVQIPRLPVGLGEKPGRLRENGVYLITGGLGGIGLEVAGYLADRVKARLVLTGRSSLPPEAEWQGWLRNHEEDDRLSLRIRRLQELKAAGAEVLTIGADVSDYERMKGAVAEAEARFGRINGIIHAAGTADYAGIIRKRTRQMTVDILKSKVEGALVLDRIFGNTKGDELDFFILFSSLSSILAPYGQVDYSAASSFLDAFAFYRSSKYAGFTLSINWDAWQEVGMARDTMRLFLGDRQTDDSQALLRYGILTSEGLAAFERMMGSTSPQVAVSTRDLRVLIENNGTDGPGASPAVLYKRPGLSVEYVSPRSRLERQIAGIWSDFLGLEKVGVHDNFFDLGCTSLDIVQVSSRLKAIFKREIPVLNFFEFPTVGSLARHLGGGDNGYEEETGGLSDRSAEMMEGKNLLRRKLQKSEAVSREN
jgi:acyl transferase domain-containing protein/acyl carrier protein